MSDFRKLHLFKGKISLLISRKALVTALSLAVLTGMIFIISTGMGDMPINPITVISVFFGGGTEMEQLVVQSFRLPRIIVALFVGMSLAVAGGILQGMIRNPLASPDVLGITGGAAAFVVLFLAVFSNDNNVLMVSIQWMPIAAFMGATVMGFLLYVLAWKNGVSPIRLVLIGIGLSALTQAVTTMLMILGPIYRASQANIWITGTVHGSTWANVATLVPWVVILMTIAFFLSRKINVLELGEDVATSVGTNVQVNRFILLLIATALIGGSVAFAGGIGFVGLMAPHMARRLVGAAYGALLPVSALLGGIFVMLADLVGRTLFSPLEIPAGVFTAGIGAPYFIYLLFKTRNS